MEVRSLGSLASIPSRAIAYVQPRPETSGDLARSSSVSAAIAGGIQGYITGGPLMAASGVLGGYAGVKAGEKSGNFMVALGAGGAVGAGLAIATTAGLMASANAPIVGGALLAAGTLGGFAGAIGTLSGSRRASTRDSVYGGILTGAMAGVMLHNPALMLAGAAGAGIAGKAARPAGRVVVGVASGAATGALAGILLGGSVQAAAAGAAAGAVLAPIGALVGPAFRQVQRNLTLDASNKLISKLDPWIAKHPLSSGQKVLAGAAVGVLTIGPIGLVAHLPGLAVSCTIGAAMGGYGVYHMLQQRKKAAAQAFQATVHAGEQLLSEKGVVGCQPAAAVAAAAN